VTDRPPALRPEMVDRLKSWLAGGAAPATRRAARRVARPVRRAVVRLVDPSLQATLDQLRSEAAAASAHAPDGAEVEVLRAELLALSRRLDAVERALADL
jgi:hypothetical protein